MNRELLVIIYAVVLCVLLMLSFFFSSSDMAYGSVDILRFDQIEDKKNKKGVLYAEKLVKNYDKTISTILLFNDTVNAGLDSLATLVGVNLAYLILGGDAENIAAISETYGMVASMITLIIKITFGEIVAKSVGKIYNLKLSIFYSRILTILDKITLPITFVVSSFGAIVTYPIRKYVNDVNIVEDDLHEMVDDIENQGSVDSQQASVLHDAITYTTTKAYEIMTPRVDIYALDIEDDIEKAMLDPKMFTFTRIPIYQETIDNIIGYVNTKALMNLKFKNEKIDIKELLISPLKFPRSIEINDILKAFKKEKKHFALIIDEYGGVEGLLTMEDILEEIVGDIFDEKDDKDLPYVKRKDGSYIVDGKFNLEDFCELVDVNYDEIDTEYVTIGGYIIELLDDKFPSVGDKVLFHDWEIEVLALDKNNAVEKLVVKKKQNEN